MFNSGAATRKHTMMVGGSKDTLKARCSVFQCKL